MWANRLQETLKMVDFIHAGSSELFAASTWEAPGKLPRLVEVRDFVTNQLARKIEPSD